jgi:RNA polymerase sigma-70 factor (sigma-E family)
VDFEQFIREKAPGLLRFTTAMSANRAVAEDILQEVLARVYQRWDRIVQLERPEAYVRRALVNEYLSWRRRWARVIPHAVIDTGATVPDHAGGHAERSALTAELAALPSRQRTVLVMRYYGGATDAEIAEALRCRPSTVRAYASRALATLRIELSNPVPTSSRSDRAF